LVEAVGRKPAVTGDQICSASDVAEKGERCKRSDAGDTDCQPRRVVFMERYKERLGVKGLKSKKKKKKKKKQKKKKQKKKKE
jgi:hypothetical protein